VRPPAIASTTDLTGDDAAAFVPACALAAASESRLVTVHAPAVNVGVPTLIVQNHSSGFV